MITELDGFIDEHGSTFTDQTEIPEKLKDSSLLKSKQSKPTKCKDCKEEIEIFNEDDDKFDLVCRCGADYSVKKEEYRSFKLDYSALLSEVFSLLSYENPVIETRKAPKYIFGDAGSELSIYLVIDPADYERTIQEIIFEAIQSDTPSLLITPHKTISKILEIQSIFSGGSLVYTIPFTRLKSPKKVKKRIRSMGQIQELEKNVIEGLETEDKSLIDKVNSNPRYILTELNHIRLLRENKEIDHNNGDRLEDIAESVFSHIFTTLPEEGGGDNLFENVPDNIFYLPEKDHDEYGDYESIMGIADTKSGSQAKFSDENAEKHEKYLKPTRKRSNPAENVAHTFVVLGISGSQDLDFFDEMNEYYKENEYMVVLTADALQMIMAAYLSHTVSNELKLAHQDFSKALYPLFHNQTFNDRNISSIPRDLSSQRLKYMTPEEYKDEYLKRSKLMVVTQKVVKKHFESISETKGDIETILTNYLSS